MPAALKIIVNANPDELEDLYRELNSANFDPCDHTETCDDIYDNDCDACPLDGFNEEELRFNLQERAITEMHVRAVGRKKGANYLRLDTEQLLRLIGRKGIFAGIEAIVGADLDSLNRLYFALVRTNSSNDDGSDPCENDRICRYFDGCRGCPFDDSMQNLCVDLVDRILTEIQARVRRS